MFSSNMERRRNDQGATTRESAWAGHATTVGGSDVASYAVNDADVATPGERRAFTFTRGAAADDGTTPSLRVFEEAFRRACREGSLALRYRIWSDAVEALLGDASRFVELDAWVQRFPSPDPEIDRDSSVARQRACVSLLGALLCRNPYGHDWHAVARDVEADLHLWNDSSQVVVAANRVMQAYVWAGQLAEASRFMRVAYERVAPKMNGCAPVHGLRATESLFHWFSGDAERGQHCADQGLELCAGPDDPWFVQLCINGAYSALGAGDAKRLNAYLRKLDTATSNRLEPERCHEHILRARAALLDGDFDAAFAWARGAATRARPLGLGTLGHLCGITLCQVRLERGDQLSDGEMRTLSQASMNPDSALVQHLAALLAVEARGGAQSGSPQMAALCRKALDTAQRQGYRRLPWWTRAGLVSLCEASYDHGVDVGFTDTLVRDHALLTSRIDLDQWPRPVRIYTLGRFSLTCDGHPLRATRKPHKRPMELLKVIVALGGRNVGVQRVCDALWPEVEGDVARHSFETTLYRLRRLIGCHQAISVVGDTVTLDHRYCWVDAWALERALGELDALLRQGAHEDIGERLHAQLDRVFSLYHGDFLHDDASGPWAVSLRERLRSRFIRQLRAGGRYWEHTERWQEAIVCYEKALEIDDLVELFYQRLIVCHTKRGHRGEASSVYQRCRKVLATTLGIQPSADTVALGRTLTDA